MNTKIARFGSLLVFCLTLAIALMPPPVQAAQNQDEVCEEAPNGNKICVCDGSDKIRFHDKYSGFKLEAHCQGKIQWTVTLVGDVIIDEEFIGLTFTIATGIEEQAIADNNIVFSRNDGLAQRELLLKTINGDKIQVTFKLR